MARSLRYILPLSVVSVAIAAGLWWKVVLPPRVAVAPVGRGPAVEAVYATGTVEPVRWAQIASTETGRIVAYPAAEGTAVAKGDVLVRLDDRKARGNIDELEARIRFLKGDLERYEALVQKSNVSRKEYEKVKSELDRARALARVANQKLADLTIQSPLDGVVIRKDGEVGEVVQAGDVLLWVGTLPPYWITAEVDEEDIPRVAAGQRTLIKADAFPEETLEGEVAEITPKGDPVNKQYRVRVLLPADSPLMIGMTTEVNIVTRLDERALLVPEQALANATLWVVEAGRARRRDAIVGIYGEGMAEIIAGVAQGELVILEPPAGLVDGDPVKVVGD